MQREHDLATLTVALEGWLRTKLPQVEDLSISPLERASAGNVNETHLFDLHCREAGEERIEGMVVRWCAQSLQFVPDGDVAGQFRVMKCLERSGLPVPKMYWLEENREVLGFPFFVAQRVYGDSPPDRHPGPHGHGMFFEATPERRTKLWLQAIEAIAKLQSLDWRGLGLSFLGVPGSNADALDQQIDHWERMLDWGASEPLPALRGTVDWLRKHRYDPSRVRLCWGDARPGNIIYRDDQVAAVLDWEFAHIGVPESDLAYFLVVDEMSSERGWAPRLEGIPGEEETIQYYERLTGTKLENFAYHKVLQTFKMAVFAVLFANLVRKTGIPGYPPDFASNNWCYDKLADLLAHES